MTGWPVAAFALVLVPVMALIGWWRARVAARKVVQAESEAHSAQTCRQMDAAASLGNDPDAARRWLHARGEAGH
ncbi:hypothetical protein [Paracoccus sp. IB05]|uniref:hypothetical protein n=1 Tax=Paracoccus sp. IB05 TaxID=2779367 RepID=UPI0018E7E137|nr:hypothetical protein [Paracoccus sp. IB05]MBJ2151870.1 hypothetical protein [Paracoccus sp. IB05]